MKKTIITIAALLAAVASFGQGTVNFTTKSGTAVDAQVIYAGTSSSGTGVAANGDLLGQLYWSPPGANTWTAVASPTPFRTGSGQGYITAGAQTTSAAAGAVVDIQFRGWVSSKLAGGSDAGFGAGATGPGYASSVLPNVTLGGGGSPPATPTLLAGLKGFSVPAIPEPSMAALGLLGAGLLLIRRKK